jgi:tetratricopeptide (TPR) repeat protein
MRVRQVWLCCWFCLGCHTLQVQVEEEQPGAPASLWDKGQQAMRAGNPDEAIALYQEELARVRPDTRCYLSLAAALVAKGDDESAGLALAHFVEANPDHRQARLYLAELLRRSRKIDEAQCQFERAGADLQQDAKRDCARLSHCHGRLMELAERQDDAYLVHLHRGIGLYWLSQGSLATAAADGTLAPEGLLCKAAAELSLARTLRPGEARPSWYLYCVWRELAQSQMSKVCLRAAREAAHFTSLTPAELQSLQLASALE